MFAETLGLKKLVLPLLLVALVLAGPTAVRAGDAGVIPDSTQMKALREAVRRAPVVLVRGDFGLREFYHARLDSTGIRSAREESAWRPRPALIATADAPRPPVPPTIAWSEISTMETQRPKKLQGAIGGLVVGLAIGLTLALNYEARYSEDFTGLGLLLGPPFVGLIGGTILGSLSGTKVIYRAPTRENP